MTLCEVWWQDGRFIVHERPATSLVFGKYHFTDKVPVPRCIRECDLLVFGSIRPDAVYCLPDDVPQAIICIAEAQKAEVVRLHEEAEAAQGLYREMMIQLWMEG